MNKDIMTYNEALDSADEAIVERLSSIISESLADVATSKIWHGHPVWFIDDNPIVGYDKLKDSVRLLFWSGQSFDEPKLEKEGSFKAAEIRYTSDVQINVEDLHRWLEKAVKIQWDYKNIIKRRGVLERL